MSFLKKNEKILFMGSYDTINRNVQGNISTLPVIVDANPGGYNIRPAQWYYINEKDDPIKWLYENYTISSYKDKSRKEKVGEIHWQGLYPDTSSQGGITTKKIERFIVEGKSGIYCNVCSIVIDFENPVRLIYFIGKK